MRVVGLPSSFYYAARHIPPILGPEAKERLRWLTCWQALRQRGLSSVEAAQTLDIPRSTLYRWQRCLMTGGPAALEDKSRRPLRRRQPTWSPKSADAVLKLREQYPRRGKDKLVVLLRREGYQTSASMVERILRRLKIRGVLRETHRLSISATKRRRHRP
jgi:transposase